MGQRSQIYVRIISNEKPILIARYFQWNYGTRMISRARYVIQHIKEMLQTSSVLYQQQKIIRLIETNFDLKDVQISSDIIKEYEQFGLGEDFNDYVFCQQHNNNGKLFIDVNCINKSIKYAFTGDDFYDILNIPNALSAEEYMNLYYCYETINHWSNDENFSEEEKVFTQNNIEYLKEVPLLTTQELNNFVNYDYK